MAKKAAKRGDGPWGEAIQYWFKEKHIRQSKVAEETGMPPNRVSRAANGLDVRMDTLRQIADYLDVPFESVLVSPLRRLSVDEGRRAVEKLAQSVSHVIDQSRPRAATHTVDPRMLAIAKRIEKLPARLQKPAIDAIADYEKVARRGRPGKPRPHDVVGLAKRLLALEPDQRKAMDAAIAEYEAEVAKRHTRSSGTALAPKQTHKKLGA